VMIAYELNDVRPMPRPAEARRQTSLFSLVDLFFLVNQHADGFTAMVLFDEGRHEAGGVEACVESWMGMWSSEVDPELPLDLLDGNGADDCQADDCQGGRDEGAGGPTDG